MTATTGSVDDVVAVVDVDVGFDVVVVAAEEVCQGTWRDVLEGAAAARQVCGRIGLRREESRSTWNGNSDEEVRSCGRGGDGPFSLCPGVKKGDKITYCIRNSEEEVKIQIFFG